MQRTGFPRTSRQAVLRRCLVAVLIGCWSVWLAGAMPAAGETRQTTVLVPRLNLRAGPGLQHPVMAMLPQGARVEVLAQAGEWVRIRFGEQIGFVINRKGYLRLDDPVRTDSKAVSSGAATARKKDLARQLKTSRQQVAAFTKKETAIVNDLDDTDRSLDQVRKRVAQISAELKALDEQMGTIEAHYRELEARAKTTETYVADRLVALYKLSWLGKFHVLASADSVFDFFSRKRAMEQILLYDASAMDRLARDKAQMQQLIDQLAAKKNEKQSRSAELSAKMDAFKAQQTRREALLREIRSKKSLQLAAIASLEAATRELNRKIAELKRDRPTASLRTKPAPLTAPSETAPATPPKPGKPFAALKGLLMMPVNGRVVSFFGPYTDRRFNVTNFQSGINIKAERGEPIRAVHRGKTLFSSWFKGFGNMIIIDHGDHYYTVYAHLEEMFKSKGDPVETGEVIATLGDSGSLQGAGLHFEIRHHGKPMNPLGWIKKG